jgi:predicted kinase
MIRAMDSAEVARDVANLRQGLGELPEPVVTPALVVVSGLPGTGKSHFSRKLAERLPCVIVESDALRRRLVLSPDYSPGESQRLFAACHLLIEELIKAGITTILDATNLVEHHREHLYRIADRLRARLIIVQLEAPQELVQERLQGRFNRVGSDDNSEADWTVYQQMRGKAQAIRRDYFVVDTSGDISPAVDKIVREANG